MDIANIIMWIACSLAGLAICIMVGMTIVESVMAVQDLIEPMLHERRQWQAIRQTVKERRILS